MLLKSLGKRMSQASINVVGMNVTDSCMTSLTNECLKMVAPEALYYDWMPLAPQFGLFRLD